jgi:hypothetical protein
MLWYHVKMCLFLLNGLTRQKEFYCVYILFCYMRSGIAGAWHRGDRARSTTPPERAIAATSPDQNLTDSKRVLD